MSERKRRRRFGTMYERTTANGCTTYYVEWREGPRGRRVTRAMGSNKREARDFLAEIEKKLLQGNYAPPPTVAEVQAAIPAPMPETTFVEYAQRLVDKRFATTKAEATVTLYRANLKALNAYFGDREIEGRRVAAASVGNVDTLAMSDYRVWRKTWRGDVKPPKQTNETKGDVTPTGPVDADTTPPAGATPAPKSVSDVTINRDVQFASVVLTHAAAEGLIRGNPLRGFRKLREERRGRRFMSKADVARLLLNAEEPFRSFLVAALYTGARPCELRALRWRDVSFDNEKLTIYRSKVKNSDSLDLHPTLAKELRRLKDARGAVKPGDHVFLNRRGNPAWDQRKAWARTLAAAGLAGSGYTLYSCRHSFACHFLTGGGAIVDLQSQLGHASVSTTQIYAQMIDERRKATVLALDYGTAAKPRKAQSRDKKHDRTTTPRTASR